MKSRSLATLLLLLLTASVFAQETSEPPDLTILEKSWRKEVLHPVGNSNPLAPNEDLIRQTRAEKAAIRQRDYELPNQTVEDKTPFPSRTSLIGTSRVNTYVYKIKVQNSGAKTIKSLDWEYQFLNPDTHEVLGQRRMTSKVKIAPGKTQVVERRSTRQPSFLVSAGQLAKKNQDQFTERVIIHRIHYTDGSVWQRP